MHTLQKFFTAFLVAILLPAAAEEAEIHVGRSATGQLKVDVSFAQPLELEPSVFPGITGYATGLLGMHSTELDEPDHDFFELSTAADLQFILLAKDAGLEVWNDTGSGFLTIGASFQVGQPPFDTHPIWNLVTSTPGTSYSLTLKMHDVNGVYLDSESFELSFTPMPLPRYLINIHQDDAQHATLSWPTNASNWSLESAASASALSWDVITNAPTVNSTNFSLQISTTDTQKFFRLRKQ